MNLRISQPMSLVGKRGPPTSELSTLNWRLTPANHRPAIERCRGRERVIRVSRSVQHSLHVGRRGCAKLFAGCNTAAGAPLLQYGLHVVEHEMPRAFLVIALGQERV